MDMKRQYELYKDVYNKVLVETASSGAYIGGKIVKEFEEEFAKYVGTKYAVSCGSGTDALVLALKAFNIGAGDEVIVPGFTFFATAEAVANVGATPVFVDVEEDVYCIDPKKLEEKITDKTKAIIPVHLYGNCADMDSINEIAKKHSLKVITDCAQSTGTEYQGNRKNALGDVACFSFFPTKNLGGIGDGGILVTDDEYVALAAKSYSTHGSGKNFEDEESDKVVDKYHNHHIGYNSRLDSLQAAFLSKRLEHLDKLLDERSQVAEYYLNNIDSSKYQLPKRREDTKHSYYLFALRHKNAGEIMQVLNEKGIESKTYYPVPVHLQKAFTELGYKNGALPVTESLCDTTFAIPLFPGIKLEEMKFVVDTLNSIEPEKL